jgi:hypothetical protein
MKMSKHFIERWRERVHRKPPTVSEIEEMVNDAVYLQRGRDLFTPRGVRLRVMGLYWVIPENIIIKIDEKKCLAVTVITPDTTDDEETI